VRSFARTWTTDLKDRRKRVRFDRATLPESADIKSLGADAIGPSVCADAAHCFDPIRWAGDYRKQEIPHHAGCDVDGSGLIRVATAEMKSV
jgi:hypothetical protein